jgi:hypothetical protein
LSKSEWIRITFTTPSSAAGIELLPVAKWKRATDDMRSTFEYLADDPANDPDCILSEI